MAVLTRTLAGCACMLMLLGAVVPPRARAHRTIATSNPAAQAAFDRGLERLYAFNIGAAREAFRAAEAADALATLPYVGEALSETFDINVTTTPAGEQRGAAAIARGMRAAAAAPADERELYAAVALRFDLARSQKQRLEAAARALHAYAADHAADAVGATLAAYAEWDASGALIDGAGALTNPARQIAADLDAALTADPDDLGAHHLRIHFWEQAKHPERALDDARYLAALTYEPGDSHLPHMAGHIFDRLGDYDAMVRVNVSACANDAAYFRLGDGPGQQYMRGYHEHDVDFVLYGLTTLGRNAEARAFAARESTADREAVALRLHDDAALIGLLGAALTPRRAIAEARLGDLAAAERDVHSAGGEDDAEVQIAQAAVARARHRPASAATAYRRAIATLGTEPGDPKQAWSTPPGEGLGAVLLAAGRPDEAEQVFAAELRRFPNDPRLEFGLAEARRAQGKDDTEARNAAAANWHGDRPLTLGDLG